jgi:hypothetical protein
MPGDHPSWGNITCPTITNTPRWTASPPDFLVTRVPLIANTTYVSTVLVLLANSEGERWRGYRFAVSRDARTKVLVPCTPLPPYTDTQGLSPAVSVLVLPLHAHLIVKVQQVGLEASMIFFPLLIPIVVDLVELCSTTLTVARSSSRAEPPPCFHRWPFLVDLISPGSQTSDLMQE